MAPSALHVGELARTEKISRGDGPISPLPVRPLLSGKERRLDAFQFSHAGETMSFRQMLEATYTDGIVVVRDGDLLFEH